MRWTAGMVFAAGLLSVAASASAQTYRPPRTSFGAPDLQGVWNNESLTKFERPKEFTALTTDAASAAAYEKTRSDKYDKAVAPTQPDAPPLAAGGDVGNDAPEWRGRPPAMMRIGGQIRTSVIVDPADGKLPLTEAARADAKARDFADEHAFDNPEDRPFDERCLLGAGGGASAPVLDVGVNNILQILQTPDHVVLLAEANHDARIVRLGDRRHITAAVKPWMGDSVGWWEGATLVVETTNFNPGERWRYGGDNFPIGTGARVVERFSRIGPGELLYAFEVTDVASYTRTWRGEMVLHTAPGRIFEYACHEGNYALANILAGAREQEKATVAGSTTK